jgi:hypothetical protein
MAAYDVFISYRHTDAEAVATFVAALRLPTRGVYYGFYTPRQFVPLLTVLIVCESGSKMPADLGGDIYARLEDRTDIDPIKPTLGKFLDTRL